MERTNINIITLFDEIKSCTTKRDLEKISDLLEEAYLCGKVSNKNIATLANV